MSASLKAKIAEVFDEPGCDKNQAKSEKERKKGCTKQLTPGAAAGGCAFDGAEKRLFKAIREICEKIDPPAIFVYQTCVTGLIGDDIEAVCKRASEKFGKPVIPVNAPGFASPKNLGNKLGAEALLDYVVGTIEPEYTTPYDINIIGEYNLSGDGRYAEVASAHRARANMMVCSKSMINIATKMAQRWGIPYFEGSFYGISDMSTTLREIARLLVESGVPSDLKDRTEALMQEAGLEVVGTSVKVRPG